MGIRKPADEPVTAARMAAAGLRTFFRIASQWQLSVEEQVTLLGSPSRSTYFKWKKEGADSLSRDTLERLSYVLGIWKALQVLLPEEAAADAWIRKANECAAVRRPLGAGADAVGQRCGPVRGPPLPGRRAWLVAGPTTVTARLSPGRTPCRAAASAGARATASSPAASRPSTCSSG
jgi:hypothetical protein